MPHYVRGAILRANLGICGVPGAAKICFNSKNRRFLELRCSRHTEERNRPMIMIVGALDMSSFIRSEKKTPRWGGDMGGALGLCEADWGRKTLFWYTQVSPCVDFARPPCVEGVLLKNIIHMHSPESKIIFIRLFCHSLCHIMSRGRF